MKFKRADILQRLQDVRRLIISEVEEQNAARLKAYQDAQAEWYERNRENLEAMKATIDLAIQNRRQLTPEDMKDIPNGSHVKLWADPPPRRQVPDTREVDAGIALLESALDENITLAEMERAGVHVRRWVSTR